MVVCSSGTSINSALIDIVDLLFFFTTEGHTVAIYLGDGPSVDVVAGFDRTAVDDGVIMSVALHDTLQCNI